MNIGEKIKFKRKEKSLTQKILSERSGVSENAIKQYESGKRNPRIEQLTKIAAVLGCSPVDLLNDDASIFEKWDAQYPNMREEVKLLEQIENTYGADTIELLENYTLLNDLGKDKAKEYIHDLLKLYKKGE